MTNLTFTKEEIIEEIKDLERRTNFSLGDIDIQITTQTKYFGSCNFYKSNFKPISICISKYICINNYPREEVIDTIRHEFCHLWDNQENQQDTSHKVSWQEKCLIVGCCPNAKASLKNSLLFINNINNERNNLIVSCPKCKNRYYRKYAVSTNNSLCNCKCGIPFDIQYIKEENNMLIPLKKDIRRLIGHNIQDTRIVSKKDNKFIDKNLLKIDFVCKVNNKYNLSINCLNKEQEKIITKLKKYTKEISNWQEINENIYELRFSIFIYKNTK